jgi:hypothetical protein
LFCAKFFICSIIKNTQIKAKNEDEKKRELAIKKQAETQKEISQSIENDPDYQARQNIVKKMLDKNINHKDYVNLIVMIDELFKDKDFKEKIIIQFPEYDTNCESTLRSELISFISNGLIQYLKKGFFNFVELNQHNSSFTMIYLMPHALTELKEKKYRAILDLKDNESEIFNQYINYALKSFNVIN